MTSQLPAAPFRPRLAVALARLIEAPAVGHIDCTADAPSPAAVRGRDVTYLTRLMPFLS